MICSRSRPRSPQVGPRGLVVHWGSVPGMAAKTSRQYRLPPRRDQAEVGSGGQGWRMSHSRAVELPDSRIQRDRRGGSLSRIHRSCGMEPAGRSWAQLCDRPPQRDRWVSRGSAVCGRSPVDGRSCEACASLEGTAGRLGDTGPDGICPRPALRWGMRCPGIQTSWGNGGPGFQEAMRPPGSRPPRRRPALLHRQRRGCGVPFHGGRPSMDWSSAPASESAPRWSRQRSGGVRRSLLSVRRR